MSSKDFDLMLDALNRPSFTVAGQKFTVRKKLSWKTMQVFINDTSMSEIQSANYFFTKAIIPGDRQRFQDLLDYEGLDDEDEADEDKLITLQQMNEIVKWLMDYYTGREAPKEANSTPGQNTTGQPLKSISLDSKT